MMQADAVLGEYRTVLFCVPGVQIRGRHAGVHRMRLRGHRGGEGGARAHPPALAQPSCNGPAAAEGQGHVRHHACAGGVTPGGLAPQRPTPLPCSLPPASVSPGDDMALYTVFSFVGPTPSFPPASVCVSCPQVAVALRAMGIPPTAPIYVASGALFGGPKALLALRSSFRNVFDKQSVNPPSKAGDLTETRQHSTDSRGYRYGCERTQCWRHAGARWGLGNSTGCEAASVLDFRHRPRHRRAREGGGVVRRVEAVHCGRCPVGALRQHRL